MAVGIFLLTCHDSAFTERRIKKYGLGIETSSLIVWLAERFGIQIALAFGLVVPSLIAVAVFATHNWTTWLAMWFGAKLLNLRYQYFSLQLEAEVDRLRGQNQPGEKDRGSTTVTSSSPSDASRPGVDR